MSSENDQTIVDRMIRDAYAILRKPESVISLLEQGDRHFGLGSEGFADAERHFDEAGSLIDELSPLTGSDFAEFTSGNSAMPATELTLDIKFAVVAIDPAVFAEARITVGQIVPEWIWDPVEKTQDIRLAKTAGEGTSHGFVRLFVSADDDQGRWFNLEVSGEGEQRLIHFRLIQFRWQVAAGDRFQEALNLTDTELALTRHLVAGGSVRSFAEKRGRSIGTARNQLKMLLRKLAIGSQQELLMLYTGFAHSLRMIDSAPGPKRHFCSRIHHEGDGDRIAWEQHGDPEGLPVLYYHPFFEGALFTEEQDAAARAAGLRIIAPWRPYFGETTGIGSRAALVESFGHRLEMMLGDIGVEKCAILANRAGAPYAISFAKHHAHRCCGAVLAGPVIPFPTWADLRRTKTGYRRPLQLTRLAPSFARVYIRATLAGSLRGDFDKFLEDLLRDNPTDRAFFRKPEVRELVRLAGTYTFAKTLDGPVEGVIMEASDWSEYCRDIKIPVVVAVGDQEGSVSLEHFGDFADEYGFELATGFQRSSELVLHDDPARIFAMLRQQLTA
ncbi:alpha/beta hydrolase [Erythrobacter crassostreae]|uniref:Alpha/beta hydrolase n=1 Tax=Erythrobacter crassostreae TaxID=2828328 RepID=A0A9X1JKN6_9SPHN|nr:alpha/beta hydrolase [Erythrobacter crassostrea]MBV7259151.1 alpha/beta hydrolase [Erythrobacter crassostrea]